MSPIEITRRWALPVFCVALLLLPEIHASEEPVNLGDFRVKGQRSGQQTEDEAARVDRPAFDRKDFSAGPEDGNGPEFELAPIEGPPKARDRALRPIELPAPEYPDRAARKGLSGYVTVEFTVNRKGRPARIEVTDARPTRVFNRAAVAAVRQWRFEPAIRDGEPVVQRVSQTIRFGEGEAPDRGDAPVEHVTLSDEAAPEPVSLEPADYPARALRQRETGRVTVAFTVNGKGRTENVEVVDSTSRLFHRAAVRAVRQWRFEPVVRDGEPAPIRVEHTIRFDF